MSKRHSAKYKLDRRLGENIWGRPKSPVNKREYGPGQHGQRRKGKLSDYGIQLRAKQKLKGYYGDITEKQFKRSYQDADRMKGDTSQNLIGLLERRLDAIVYRAKFAPTIFRGTSARLARPCPRERHQVQHCFASRGCWHGNHAVEQGAGNGAGDRSSEPDRA
jgi:ribosomal protein S4